MTGRGLGARQKVVVVVLCCLTTAALSTQQQQQQQQFLQEPELAGVLPSTHWLFHMAHTSKLNCAAVCGQQSRCHAFTFIGSRTGACYGYRAVMVPDTLGSSVTGAKTYLTTGYTLCKELTETAQMARVIQLLINPGILCDGTWLVFQRRQSGVVDFYRGWDDYRIGFGDEDEFWLGLEAVRLLTSQGQWTLTVDLMDRENVTAEATYTNFRLGSEVANYPILFDNYTGGTAGDSLTEKHHGQPFSTKDRDNDNNAGNCAVKYHGAWWYKKCHRCNLNGDYNNDTFGVGLTWKAWRGQHYSLPYTQMKIQRV